MHNDFEICAPEIDFVMPNFISAKQRHAPPERPDWARYTFVDHSLFLFPRHHIDHASFCK